MVKYSSFASVAWRIKRDHVMITCALSVVGRDDPWKEEASEGGMVKLSDI